MAGRVADVSWLPTSETNALADWRFWAMMVMLWGSFGYLAWYLLRGRRRAGS
jgi:hypothetical protein